MKCKQNEKNKYQKKILHDKNIIKQNKRRMRKQRNEINNQNKKHKHEHTSLIDRNNVSGIALTVPKGRSFARKI